MPTTHRFRRIAIIGVASVLSLAVIAWFARDMIATSVARTVASRMLGVTVEIDAVRIDVFGLAVEVDGLRVANPEGWGTPLLLNAGRIALRVSSESSSQKLIVDSVGLSKVSIWFIRNGDKNNVADVVANISKPSSGDAKPAEPKTAPAMDLLIRMLVLDEVDVHYTERSSIAGDIPVAVHLKHVEVKNIDAKTAGKGLAEQLVAQVFEAVVVAVVAESGNKLPAALRDPIDGAVRSGGRLGASAINMMGEAATKGGNAVGGLLQGIGDAFGGGKKDGEDKKGSKNGSQ